MIEITVKEKDYQLEVTPRTALNMEEKLGYNPINLIIRMQNNELPKIKDSLVILHCALQKYNHGLSFDDTVSLYTAWCAEGHDITDLIKIMIECFKQSGLIKFDDNPKNV